MSLFDSYKREPAKGIVHVWPEAGETFTYTSGSWGTGDGGDWWMPDVDMRDWPADDIIDYHARELARRNPA